MEGPTIRRPGRALDRVRTGSFSMGLEVSADVDASITIEELGVEFGPAQRGGEGEGEGEGQARGSVWTRPSVMVYV